MESLPLRHVCAPIFGAVLLVAGLSAHAATLTVGPGQKYLTIKAAVAAAHDGDTVNVMAGTYINDFAEVTAKITLRAIGGQANLQATGTISNGKGILITDTDVTVEGFSFSGAKVTNADGANGAGLRYQGGNLTVTNCYFYNNQDGLLSNPDTSGSITIRNSEFASNGMSTGPSAGYTHNLYVGEVGSLDIENSYFHDSHVGHEIKSRALKTTVNNTRIADGPTGTGSYSIDLPNGGVAVITNNQIEKGPHAGNPVIISFGEEGGVYAGSTLTVYRNLIENDLASVSTIGVRGVSGITSQIVQTRAYGLSLAQLGTLPDLLSGTVMLATEPAIGTGHPW